MSKIVGFSVAGAGFVCRKAACVATLVVFSRVVHEHLARSKRCMECSEPLVSDQVALLNGRAA